MKSTRGIHWVTPVTMVASLVAGCLLSLGHHLFYMHLTGTDAPTGRYSIAGTEVSKQKFNTAVGTAFAFLVKSMLTLAIAIAYVQAFWRTIKVSEKGQRLSTLDTTFSILGNALNFVKLHIWIKFPLLFLLAVIAWSISIASIITPATLSVQSLLSQPSAMRDVPKFDFTNYGFFAPMKPGGPTGLNYTEYCYRGPGQLVQRVASAVGAQGLVLPITPPSSNATWTSSFWGPSLTCTNVEGQDRDDIWANVWDYFNDKDRCRESFGYMAWAPTVNTSLPFGLRNGTVVHQPGDNSLTTGATAEVLIAATPSMFILNNALAYSTAVGACMMFMEDSSYKNYSEAVAQGSTYESPNQFFGDGTLLRCQFNNASYSATFEYVNGRQTIETSVEAASDVVPLVPVGCVTGPIAGTNAAEEDQMLQGVTDRRDRNCSTLNVVGEDCRFDPELVRTLSYQSIADAFVELVQGTVGLGGKFLPHPAVTFNSSIAKTVLMDTTELSFLQTYEVDDLYTDLATFSQESNGTSYIGLSNTKNITSRGPLARALEGLFQNLTLSLLSEQYLQYV